MEGGSVSGSCGRCDDVERPQRELEKGREAGESKRAH